MESETTAPTRAKRQPRPKNVPPKHHPYEIIERAKERGISEVIVSFSGGKESIVTLDLCAKHFRRVEAFFMYLVRGLEFQEIALRAAEQRYGIEIKRIPDFRTARHLRHASFRHPTMESARLPAVSLRQVGMYVRYELFGGELLWIASGESANESVQRRGMIQSCEGIDRRRGYIYPLAYWAPQDVLSYMSMNGLTLPPEYDVFGTGASFGGLRMEHIAPVAEHFPDDFQKIKAMFPLVDVQLARWRVERERNERERGSTELRPEQHRDGDVVHEGTA